MLIGLDTSNGPSEIPSCKMTSDLECLGDYRMWERHYHRQTPGEGYILVLFYPVSPFASSNPMSRDLFKQLEATTDRRNAGSLSPKKR